MSILCRILLGLLLVASPAAARDMGLLVSEPDHNPENVFVYKIIWPNGTISVSNAIGTIDLSGLGGGDMSTSVFDQNADSAVDVGAGGTAKKTWTQYAIPYLSNTTVFGEIAISANANYLLATNATKNGYTWVDPASFESHTSNDIDPDRLAGDSTDDDKIADALLLVNAGNTYTNFGGVNDDTVDELMAAIDTAIGGKAAADHDATHVTGGSDEIDGDKLDIDWNPSNYTPTLVENYSTSADNLTSHLKGIDAALQAVGSSTLSGLTDTDVSNPAAGHLLIYDGTDTWDNKAMSGDATISAAGALALAAGSVAADELAATLTFSDGDFLDLSGITMSASTAEGLAIPSYQSGATGLASKNFITYDPDNNAIMVWESGGWTNASAGSGAATSLNFLVTSAEGSLSAESVFTAGYALDATDAGGDGGAFTVSFDPTEVSADGSDTWSDGSQASVVWTWDVTGTDPVVTFGNGIVNVTTGSLQKAGSNVLTAGDSGTVTSAIIANDSIVNDDVKSDAAIAASKLQSTVITESDISTGLTVTEGSVTVNYDGITDGTNYQKVAASDVDASGHVNRFYDSDGSGYITITGITNSPAKTFSDTSTTVMEVGQTHGGLIFGDTTPDTAGEIGYASNALSFHDGTASRTVATTDSAQSFTANKTLTDSTAWILGTDSDWSISFNNVAQQALFSSPLHQSVIPATSMFGVRVNNAGSGSLPANQQVFTVVDNVTQLLGIDAEGDLTITGGLIAGTSGNSYVTLANNSGGFGGTNYQLYVDGGTWKFSENSAEKTIAKLEDTQTFSGAKTFSDTLALNRGSTSSGQLAIYEDSDAGTNKVTIGVPSLAADYTLTLPADDGTANQALLTDGSGVLSWGSPSATAAGATTGMVQYNASGTGGALAADAGFIYTAATDSLTLGEDGTDGALVLYNELGASDYTATISPAATQSANIAIALPSVTSTLSTADTAETISGTKTFSANPVLSNANGVLNFSSATSATISASAVPLAFKPSGDTDDYLTLATPANVPTFATVGNANLTFDILNTANASVFSITNSDGTYAANLFVDGNIQIGTSGPRARFADTKLEIRNAADDAYADVKGKDAYFANFYSTATDGNFYLNLNNTSAHKATPAEGDFDSLAGVMYIYRTSWRSIWDSGNLANPVTGPASPTAGRVIKWGASGQAAVDATPGTDYEVPDTQTSTHSSPSTTNPLSPTWTSNMHTVWYGATGTINLPAASGYAARSIMIYNTGAFTITIDPNASEVIVRDGTTQTGGVSMTLSSGAGNYVALLCDGVRWITFGYKGTLAAGS